MIVIENKRCKPETLYKKYLLTLDDYSLARLV